jgi:hypothetical protein
MCSKSLSSKFQMAEARPNDSDFNKEMAGLLLSTYVHFRFFKNIQVSKQYLASFTNLFNKQLDCDFDQTERYGLSKLIHTYIGQLGNNGTNVVP